MPNKRVLPRQAPGFIETMGGFLVPKLPNGLDWSDELLRDPLPNISWVAQEVMLRNSGGSAHLLAGALRVRKDAAGLADHDLTVPLQVADTRYSVRQGTTGPRQGNKSYLLLIKNSVL
jgi:hypothetical protein